MQVARWPAEAVRCLFFVLLVFLLQLPRGRGSLYECLVPFHYCLGSLMPIGYRMQNVEIHDAILELHEQCPSMEYARMCVSQYRCSHEPSRRRLDGYLHFFSWLCDQIQVFEANTECWEFPFANDVITCGERHIAGPFGTHLMHDDHPCPFVQDMVVCLRERMLERDECTEEAVQLYINIIIRSSIVFAECPQT